MDGNFKETLDKARALDDRIDEVWAARRAEFLEVIGKILERPDGEKRLNMALKILRVLAGHRVLD